MKTLFGTAAAVICGFAPWPGAAADFTVQLSGVERESTAPALVGIEGFDINGPLFNGAPAEITFFKKIDRTTPLLFQFCAKGQHIRKAVLTARRSNAGGGDNGELLKIELKEVFVTGISQGGDEAAADDETVKLRCSSIFFRYYPLKPNPVSAAFLALATTGPDKDRDGMPDGYERHFGLNPSVPDATGDLDGDGLSNGEEANLGFSPISGNSFFEASATGVPGDTGAVDLAWEAIPGKPYQVQWSPDLKTRFQVLETFTPDDSKAVRRIARRGLTGFFQVHPAP